MDEQRIQLSLPVKGSLRSVSIASVVITGLVATASTVALTFPEATYPAINLRQAYLPNDVANLVIGVPAMLVSMALAQRGVWAGVLFWPGAVLYVLYNYLAVLLSMPSTPMIVLSAALVALCLYALAGLIRRMDGTLLRNRLAHKAPNRLCGFLLAGLGILTLARAISVLAVAALRYANPGVTDVGVSVVDCLIAPAFIFCGVLLWQRKPMGYCTGPGLLLTANLLFAGLIVLMLAQPLIGGVGHGAVEFLTIGGTGLVFLFPLVFLVRRVQAAQSQN